MKCKEYKTIVLNAQVGDKCYCLGYLSNFGSVTICTPCAPYIYNVQRYQKRNKYPT